MALRLSVLAKDVKTEGRWMDELRGQLRLVSDIELGAVSGGVAPGELILVDGSDPDEVIDLLARFPAEDRADMVTDGEIAVTCEFCSTTYKVQPGDLTP